MKKSLIILFICLFVTGCSVNYNLTINKDLSITEEISAAESIDFFEKEFTYYERKDAIDSLWESLTSSLDKNYSYKYNSNDTGVIINNKYNSIDEYINSKLYKQYFEKIEYSISNNKVIFKSSGEFYPYTTQDFEKFAIDDFRLVINVPYNVVKSNADIKNGNTYIWKIDSKTKSKKIYLEFDLKNNNYKSSETFDFKILFGIIIGIGIVVIYIYYCITKNDNSI